MVEGCDSGLYIGVLVGSGTLLEELQQDGLCRGIIAIASRSFGGDEVDLSHTHEDDVAQPRAVCHRTDGLTRSGEELVPGYPALGVEPILTQVVLGDLILEVLVDTLAGTDGSIAIGVDIHVPPEASQ